MPIDLSSIEGLSLTAEQQKAADKIHDDAVDKAKAPLDAKNKELLAEKKQLQDKAAADKKAADEALLKAAEESGDVQKYKETIEQLKSEKEASDKKAKEVSDGALIDGAVNTFLSDHVADDQAARMFMGQKLREALKVDDGKVVPVNVGQSMTELTTSLVSDDGHKSYIKVKTGTGGGASGNSGNGSAGAKQITKADFDKMTPMDRVKFAKEGGEVHDSL